MAMYGIERHVIEGVTVKIISPGPRQSSTVSGFATIGVDIAISAMREALRKRRCKPDEILRHARALRLASLIKPYLEAMTTDEG